MYMKIAAPWNCDWCGGGRRHRKGWRRDPGRTERWMHVLFKQIFSLVLFFFLLYGGGVGGEAEMKVIVWCSKTNNALNIFSREGCSRFLAYSNEEQWNTGWGGKTILACEFLLSWAANVYVNILSWVLLFIKCIGLRIDTGLCCQ